MIIIYNLITIESESKAKPEPKPEPEPEPVIVFIYGTTELRSNLFYDIFFTFVLLIIKLRCIPKSHLILL